MPNPFEEMMAQLSRLTDQVNEVKARHEAQEEILWTIYYELKRVRGDLAETAKAKATD